MPITGRLHGVEIAVTALNTDYRLRCVDDCSTKSVCPLRRLCGRPGEAELRLALISLEIANGGPHPFSPQADAWELVDSQGYSVGGAALCETLLPRDFVQADLWSVSPQTRVRTMLAFPLGECQPHALLYGGDAENLRLKLGPMQIVAEQEFRQLGRFVERGEKLKGKAKISVKKRGKIRLTECRSYRAEDGSRRYVFIGKK